MSTDGSAVTVKVSWKLEKFDGEAKDGAQPVEVLEGSDDMQMTQAQLKELTNGAN